MALKYHPDKNTDCDSSCLFTLIQSAYERMVEIAPESIEALQDAYVNPFAKRPTGDPTTRTNNAPSSGSSGHNPSSGAGNRPQHGRGSNAASSVYTPAGDFRYPPTKDAGGNRASGGDKPSPPLTRRTSDSGGGRFDPEFAGASTAAQASQVQSMSTDQLRDAIRVFGVSASNLGYNAKRSCIT
jgi:curved DNA-binding protein CbpA